MKKLFILLGIVLYSFCLFSQGVPNKEQETDEIIDSFLMEEEAIDGFIKSLSSFQFLYVSVNYDRDSYFSGRDIGIDQYTIKPQVSYMHANGFYANISGAYYSEFTPRWDYTSISLGYRKRIDKKEIFIGSAGYTRYSYSDGVDNPFENALQLGITARDKKRKIGMRFSSTYLFGDDDSFQFSLRSYANFQLYKNKTTSLLMSPQITLIAGEFTFELAQTSFQNGSVVIDYVQNDVFDLINTQINIPLQYTYDAFDVELGYTFNIPSAIGNESDLKTTGYFNLSVAYLINL